MLYRLLKILVQITLRAYFRRFRLDGAENAKVSGPVIYVANHPSAFMDPLVVASSIRQPLHFIAAAEYFGKGAIAWIYRNWFHMIPVYRPGTLPGKAHKNDDMFRKCYEHLAKGGSMLIFPEGNSITEKRLRELKTGVARIAFGAEEEYHFNLGVKIIPFGLNYSNPHRFRSDLYASIGEPIHSNTYRERYRKDPRGTVLALTEDIEVAMKKQLVHIDSEQLDSVVDKVQAVYKRDLKNEFNISYRDQDKEFKMDKDIVQAIEHFEKEDPEGVRQMEVRLDDYLGRLREANLSDRAVKGLQTGNRLGDILVMIFGFPLFLIGAIHNVIPYFLATSIVKNMKLDTNFRGSIALAMGMGIFLIWYLGISITASFILHSWWVGPLYFLLMYVSGLHALRYMILIAHDRQRRNLNKRFRENKELVAELIVTRKGIIDDLETYRSALVLDAEG